jgi:hypothetical protein
MLSKPYHTQASVSWQSISTLVQAYYDNECISFVWKRNGERVVSLRTAHVKETNLERDPISSSSGSEEMSCQYNNEDNHVFCGFCHIKYCDPVSQNMGSWL